MDDQTDDHREMAYACKLIRTAKRDGIPRSIEMYDCALRHRLSRISYHHLNRLIVQYTSGQCDLYSFHARLHALVGAELFGQFVEIAERLADDV